MDDAPIRVILLRDADRCSSNQELIEARSKFTIKALEIEYDNWFNDWGNERNFTEELQWKSL